MDGPGGRYTVLVGEGSQVVFATVKAVVIALAVAAPIVVPVSAAVTYMLVSRSMRSVDASEPGRRDQHIGSDRTSASAREAGEYRLWPLTMNEMLARIEAGHSAQQRFVGDASHELRSPLTTIISALEVAVAHPELLNGELAKTTLIPEAHRMQALVEDLLLLARADERGLTMAHDDVDLDDLGGTRGGKAQSRKSLDDPYRCDTDADRAATRVRLSRMLRNLLDNAARHAASGDFGRGRSAASTPCSPSTTTGPASQRPTGSGSSAGSSGSTPTAHEVQVAPALAWRSCGKSLRRIAAASRWSDRSGGGAA